MTLAPTATRIAIVEDEGGIRRMLHDLFTGEDGVDVVAALGSVEEALDRLPGLRPEVVIMDINLPGASGIEGVAGLREQLPGTQFLMYTMHDDDHRVFEALRAGANGYLLKSAGPDEVVQAVHEVLRGGAPMSAHVARRVVTHFQERSRPGNALQELSIRENEVLGLLAQGLLYKEIGDRLGIAVGTVKQHIHRIYEKLHVQNRTEAVNRYFGR